VYTIIDNNVDTSQQIRSDQSRGDILFAKIKWDNRVRTFQLKSATGRDNVFIIFNIRSAHYFQQLIKLLTVTNFTLTTKTINNFEFN